MDKGLSDKLVTLLTSSEHSGDQVARLDAYYVTAKRVTEEQPEFMAHLIAWNRLNSLNLDSKIALPLATLSVWKDEGELLENSFAHIALLDPRSLKRAIYYAKATRPEGNSRRLRRLVEAYLRERERRRSWWDADAVQHRKSIKTLYAFSHIRPSPRVNRILFEENYREGEVFDVIKKLNTMPAKEAAEAIVKYKIPLNIAQSALGKKFKHPELLALKQKAIEERSKKRDVEEMSFNGIMGTRLLRLRDVFKDVDYWIL